MSKLSDERVIVTLGKRTLGVSITMGDVQIAVKLPSPAGISELGEEQARATALRHVRRALEVAREELG